MCVCVYIYIYICIARLSRSVFGFLGSRGALEEASRGRARTPEIREGGGYCWLSYRRLKSLDREPLVKYRHFSASFHVRKMRARRADTHAMRLCLC